MKPLTSSSVSAKPFIEIDRSRALAFERERPVNMIRACPSIRVALRFYSHVTFCGCLGAALWMCLPLTVSAETIPPNERIQVEGISPESDLATNDRPVSFQLDVQPILTALGCNAGACHGKQRGQNGFQLSLLGFDSDYDHAALTREGRGRRIFPASPERSLLIQKATAELPHGGGRRLDPNSIEYDILVSWIRNGAPRRIENEPELLRVTLNHNQLVLDAGESGSLSVTAHYSDDSTRDVTGSSSFQSNEASVASVSNGGEITAGELPGETAVMARYLQSIVVCRVLIPMQADIDDSVYESLPVRNEIDSAVWNKLRELRMLPSDSISDAAFARRVYLDVIGRLPTSDEARQYIEDTSQDKRAQLIDQLLESPEYADHWSNKWADLLRPNPYRVGIKAVLNYDDWIRERFRENQPYDEFVYELLTATGSTWTNGATTLFRDRRSPDEVTTLVSQLFLGIRLECAKCHHHPFEKWGQDDFYGLAAYFARVGRKGTGLSPPISGGEEIILPRGSGEVRHPISGLAMTPEPLYGTAEEVTQSEDPRVALANWIISPSNEYFARVQANRIWTEMLGRGIVEPVDDLRSTNPPVNEQLLDVLAEHFQSTGFDNKALIRLIANSHVYSLSSIPNELNQGDQRNYSRNYRRVIRAEALLDSLEQITGVENTFSAMPPGSDARAIWTHRVGSLFLDTFGRPNPNQDPPCERLGEPSMTQTLHLMNARDLHAKLSSSSGRCAELASSELSIEEIVNELYLSVYSRMPSEDELAIANSYFATPDLSRQQAIEDLVWALLNTPEFSYRD